jgi:hypothetical protein
LAWASARAALALASSASKGIDQVEHLAFLHVRSFGEKALLDQAIDPRPDLGHPESGGAPGKLRGKHELLGLDGNGGNFRHAGGRRLLGATITAGKRKNEQQDGCDTIATEEEVLELFFDLHGTPPKGSLFTTSQHVRRFVLPIRKPPEMPLQQSMRATIRGKKTDSEDG